MIFLEGRFVGFFALLLSRNLDPVPQPQKDQVPSPPSFHNCLTWRLNLILGPDSLNNI